jgi:hypothetical protein
MKNVIYFVMFGFIGSKAYLHDAQIRLASEHHGIDKCTIYMSSFYLPIYKALDGRRLIDVSEARDILAEAGFVETDRDYDDVSNQYDLDAIRAMNPPSAWLEAYLFRCSDYRGMF